MRIRAVAIVLLCLNLCSCSESPTVRLGGVGDDPSWIRPDEARRMGDQLIARSGYVHAQIVEERGEWQLLRYRYATNDILVPVTVVVDRKTGKARLERVSR